MVDGEFVGVHVDAVTTLDNSEAWHVKANFLWVKQSTEISFQVCKEEQGTYQVKIMDKQAP
jgi:hypothetical protein